MVRGVFYAVTSMALWGLAFVLPLFVVEFSAGEIALGRIIFYGVVSLIFAACKHSGDLSKLPWKYWRISVVFALASSLLYYIFLVIGIRCLGGPLATALCSFLPILSSIYGNYCHKVYPWRILALPLSGIFLGLSLMHLGDMEISQSVNSFTFVLGLVMTLTAVVLWSWYSVRNVLFLHKQTEVDASDWVTLMGIFSLVGGVLGVFALLITSADSLYLPHASKAELTTFIVASLINGFFVSWLTNFLWNKASRLLPIAFLSQLSVFEILFGLTYVYIKGASLPSPLECVGVLSIATGLFLSARRTPATEQ